MTNFSEKSLVQMGGIPSGAKAPLFQKIWMVEVRGLPPFAKSAKDGAPTFQ
jgi:hypothetical protein